MNLLGMLSLCLAVGPALPRLQDRVGPPRSLDANVTVAIDPLSRTVHRQVRLGTDSTQKAQLVVVGCWARPALLNELSMPYGMGGEFYTLESALKQQLPWTSPSRSFVIPELVQDIHLMALVQLRSRRWTATYMGGAVFSVPEELYVWDKWPLHLKRYRPTLDAKPARSKGKDSIDLEGKDDIDQEMRMASQTLWTIMQPHMGTLPGLQMLVKFTPQGNDYQLELLNFYVLGPTNGWNPRRLLLWWRNAATPLTCETFTTFPTAQSCYDEAALSMPVPHALNPARFKPAYLVIPGTVSTIQIVAVIQEWNAGVTQYRVHIGNDLAVHSGEYAYSPMGECEPVDDPPFEQ